MSLAIYQWRKNFVAEPEFFNLTLKQKQSPAIIVEYRTIIINIELRKSKESLGIEVWNLEIWKTSWQIKLEDAAKKWIIQTWDAWDLW